MNEQETKWAYFEREELQRIRERALGLSGSRGTSSMWELALFSLAEAADRLDAMTARSTEHGHLTCFFCNEVMVHAQEQNEEGDWVVRWLCGCEPDLEAINAPIK